MEVEIQVDPKYHRHFIQRRGQVRAYKLIELLFVVPSGDGKESM